MIVSKDEGIKIDNEEVPYLLKIIKCKKVDEKNKMATFIIDNNKTIDLKYKLIADPSYDTIFKKIFYDISPENDNIDGKTRLISFINGILFPDAEDDDIKVRKIKYLQNEIVTYGNEVRKGTFIFDVPCICTCWGIEYSEDDSSPQKKNETIFGVDIEMQIMYQKDYPERFYKYNVRLSTYHQVPFIVLSLLNFKSRSAILDIYNSNSENESNKMKKMKEPEEDTEMKDTASASAASELFQEPVQSAASMMLADAILDSQQQRARELLGEMTSEPVGYGIESEEDQEECGEIQDDWQHVMFGAERDDDGS